MPPLLPRLEGRREKPVHAPGPRQGLERLAADQRQPVGLHEEVGLLLVFGLQDAAGCVDDFA